MHLIDFALLTLGLKQSLSSQQILEIICLFVILLLINIFNEIFFRQSEGRDGANLLHPIFSQVLNVVCLSVVVIESEPLFELVCQIKSNHMNTNTYSQGEKESQHIELKAN